MRGYLARPQSKFCFTVKRKLDYLLTSARATLTFPSRNAAQMHLLKLANAASRYKQFVVVCFFIEERKDPSWILSAALWPPYSAFNRTIIHRSGNGDFQPCRAIIHFPSICVSLASSQGAISLHPVGKQTDSQSCSEYDFLGFFSNQPKLPRRMTVLGTVQGIKRTH